MSEQKHSSNWFWGLFFVVIGSLFLMRNLYGWHIGEIIRDFWPLILIAIGLKIIWDRRSGKDIHRNFPFQSTGHPDDHVEKK